MISNLSEVKAHHRRFLAKHARLLDIKTRGAAQFIEEYVRQNPTFKPRTGRLQSSVQGKVVRTGGRTIVIRGQSDGRKAPYNQAIEFGARPHRIVARKKKALRFVVNGQPVFRRAVNHPGNKPYKFLYRATYAAGRKFGVEMQADMARLASTF